MNTANVFKVLDVVDSSNNYAMGALHEGLTGHGAAFFAKAQTHGKGQRNKRWHSQPSENLLLSVVMQPPPAFHQHPFLFNATASMIIRDFLQKQISETVNIKWPNDLYIRDRKAGGILIENKYRGHQWLWAVVGTGININQTGFPSEAGNPVSIRQITGNFMDPEILARELHQQLVSFYYENMQIDALSIIRKYNQFLLGCNKKVVLKKNGQTFETTIHGANEEGFLITSDFKFAFGEVEWVGMK